MIYMVARILPERHGSDVILITTISPVWPPAMARLLKEGFALSVSEVAICELVADGLNPAAIAEARNSALATVRTQIKKIMGKTHCGSQAELVRLLHSVMRVADQEDQRDSESGNTAERETIISLSDRTMPVEHFGDPNGYPVIFFHGMLDGIAIPRAFQAELKRHKLRMICPIRPFFGFAPGASGHPRTAPQRFGVDVATMIEQMGLKNPILLGYMGGMIYAHGVAATLPSGTIRGILGVSSAVPIVGMSQFSSMSRRQRLVGYTARYTPRILPFVVRAGISQMDRGGARTFLHSLYENAPDDLPLTADPETRDTILAGYRFTVQQGHRAFEIDSHTIVQNWSHLIDGSDVKIRLLHGISDPASDVTAVRAFAKRYPKRVSLDVLDQTGQLILYKYPSRVIAELCAIRDHGVVSPEK